MNQCKKIKGKDYEAAGSVAILNFMRDELYDLYESNITMENIHYLHKNNVNDFKRMWGKQSCCWCGSYRNWIWLHEFPDCKLYVLAAPQRGTSYEATFHGVSQKAKMQIKEFLRTTLAELRTIQ